MIPDDEMLLTALERDTLTYQDHICDVHIPAPILLIIALQVQLALRHPQNTGTTVRHSRDFVEQTQQMFREKGMEAFAEVLERGWQKDK